MEILWENRGPLCLGWALSSQVVASEQISFKPLGENVHKR